MSMNTLQRQRSNCIAIAKVVLCEQVDKFAMSSVDIDKMKAAVTKARSVKRLKTIMNNVPESNIIVKNVFTVLEGL